MNKQNIISAGRMMAIVTMLLGAFRCGAAFAQMHRGMVWNVVLGGALVVCGLALLVMFARLGPAKTPRRLTVAILLVGTMTALSGVGAIVLAHLNPSSWMMAIVGLAVFIDALCLYISVSGGGTDR